MMLNGYFCCFYLGNVMSTFSIVGGFSFLKHIFVYKVADIFPRLRDYYLLLILFLPKSIYTLPRAVPEPLMIQLILWLLSFAPAPTLTSFVYSELSCPEHPIYILNTFIIFIDII